MALNGYAIPLDTDKELKEAFWSLQWSKQISENKSITFIKQVLALIPDSPLLDTDHFPEDVKERAKIILAGCNKGGSAGSYSDTPGLEMADYIMATRDGGIECDWKNLIIL